MRVEPTRRLREDRAPVYGTKLDPELVLTAAPVQILGHRVPHYDWRLGRLEQVPVLREGATADGGDNVTDLVWAETVRIGVQAVPVDEPERLLWELRPTRPLGPGVYAVHWGAFEGDPTTDNSAYVVRIVDPDAVEVSGEEGAEGGEGADGDEDGAQDAAPSESDSQ